MKQAAAALTIGGILTGMPLAVVSYLVIFRILDRYHEAVKINIRNKTRKIRQKIRRPRSR